MSYSPLLSFGPSTTVPGSAYLLLRLSALECLNSLADDMAHYALCWLLPGGQVASRPPQSLARHQTDLLG